MKYVGGFAFRFGAFFVAITEVVSIITGKNDLSFCFVVVLKVSFTLALALTSANALEEK